MNQQCNLCRLVSFCVLMRILPRVVGVCSGLFEQLRALLDMQFNNTTVNLINAKQFHPMFSLRITCVMRFDSMDVLAGDDAVD